MTQLNLYADYTPGRRFCPENAYRSDFKQEDIEVPTDEWVFQACPRSEEKCPECKRYIYHAGCIVVAIDGACSNNGKAEALSSVGVYYGDGNDSNISHALTFSEKHTNQIAELKACLFALRGVRWIMANPPEGMELMSVVIKSDSEYVVRGVTEWLPKWKGNGWKNCKGQQVANIEYFLRIESVVKELEQHMSVKFWLVPRDMNCLADSLAKSAL